MFLKLGVPNVYKKSWRMKLQVKFRAEDLHRIYSRYFWTNLMAPTSTEQLFIKDLYIDTSCVMINILRNKFSLNGSSSQEMFCKKNVLGNFSKFTGKHLWLLLYKMWLVLQFSILLVSSFIEDFLFNPFQQKNEMPWWSSNIYCFLEYRFPWCPGFQKKFDRW